MASAVEERQIHVRVEDLYNKALEMKEAGEIIAVLDICDPVPDIELGRHITFEGYGGSYGAGVFYDQIEEATPDEVIAAINYIDPENDEEGLIEFLFSEHYSGNKK